MTWRQWKLLADIMRVICTGLMILIVLIAIGAWFTVNWLTAAIVSGVCVFVVRVTFQMWFDE